jgi:REP element-mobilizing transposase RayT
VFPYHVVNRANNREWFKLPLDVVWQIFSEIAWETHFNYGVKFHDLVLMSNHFHLLISTPHADLGQAMSHFLGSVTRTLNALSGREGHVFNGPYKWSLITTARYYAYALKYIYRNPVKAGIVAWVEDYPFSSLHERLGMRGLRLPLTLPGEGAGDGLLPEAPGDLLPWLNTPFRNEEDDLVRRAMRRKVFEFPRKASGYPFVFDAP